MKNNNPHNNPPNWHSNSRFNENSLYPSVPNSPLRHRSLADADDSSEASDDESDACDDNED